MGDAGALERCVAEAALERLPIFLEQRREIRLGDIGAHAELVVARRARELHVPRTDVLTHVTSEQPLAYEPLLDLAELGGVLDREVGDAAPRVEHARCDERARRACVQTGAAGAAPIRLERQIGDEIRVGQHDADEGERAPVGVDQHHVLPDPAEPCPLRQLPLGDGSRVDIATGLRAGSDFANHGGQPLEPTTEHAMVVRRPGVLGHLPRGWTDPGRKPGVIGSVEVVLKRDHGDLGVWHDAGGVLSLLRLPVEVRHGPGVACGQPTVELGSVRVRLESGYPDRVEPQRERSTFHLDGVARRLRATSLLDASFHTCIVSRRQRANRTTSSSGGTVSSSPYAVNMRHRT